MNCHESRHYLTLYMDSELDPKTSFEIAEHLRQCEPCRKRFDHEERLEKAMIGRLRHVTPPDGLFERLTSKATTRSSRRWRRWVGVAAGILIVIGALRLFMVNASHHELDLAQATSESHRKVLADQTALSLVTSSPDAIEQFFEGKFTFHVPCPRAQDAGLKLLGGQVCHLDKVPAALVLAHDNTATISVFYLASAALDQFPMARERLASKPGVHFCSVDGFNFAMVQRGEAVACAVGQVPREQLSLLLAHPPSGP